MLSVVIIAKNESHNLPRCLQSVQSVADEVIVVDSDSNDGTPELAESLGARVFQRSFTTYADQKNWAASKATQPYILSLDADESVSEALLADIKAWKSRPPHANAAWSMPRLTHYCGDWIRHGGWYPDRKIRLWSAGAGEWKPATEGGMLHESWAPHDGVEVFEFDSDLLHYSYHTTADHHRQFAKFSLLGAEDARRAGRTSSSLKPFARAAFQWVKQAIVQWGWRDGRAGLRVAKWSAVAAFWKWNLVKAAPSHRAWSRVAIVRSDALGDNILTLPLAGALGRLLPHVEVVWICRPYARPVVAKSKVVHTIRVWRKPTWTPRRRNLVRGGGCGGVRLPRASFARCGRPRGCARQGGHGSTLGGFSLGQSPHVAFAEAHPEHETAQGLRLLHGLGLPARWHFPEREDWMDLLEWHTSSAGDPVPEGLKVPCCCIQETMGRPTVGPWRGSRAWPRRFGRRCASGGHGSPQERSALTPWLERMSGTPGFTDAAGAWTLAQLMDALVHVRCVVASSTGPLHMAAAQGTPTVGLYRIGCAVLA